MSTASSDSLFAKWEAWLVRIDREQLTELLMNRDVFAQMNECAAPYVGSYEAAHLHRWMSQNYVAFAATAIRRMMERPKKTWNSISFCILLKDLAANEAILTRERYRKLYENSNAKLFADKHFDRILQSQGAPYMSAAKIESDISALEQICEPVFQLVNKVIAHTEADPNKVGRTSFAQIDAAIDALLATYSRYKQLITGNEYSDLPYTSFDVRDDFRKLWPPRT